MKYKLLLIITFASISVSQAQQMFIPKVDSDTAKKVKTTYHYLGVQANQLLNQIFNFNGSATAVTNPYLIVYSMNSRKTGWGLNVGLGYNVNTTTDNSDPNNERKTTDNNFALRMGIEKKTYLSKKWMASYGLDLVYSKISSETTTGSAFQFNTSSTISNNSTASHGFGPRLALNYFISDKIMIGTEATYYLKGQKITDKLTNNTTTITFDPITGQSVPVVSSSTTTTNQKSTNFTFTAPIAIFLIVKM